MESSLVVKAAIQVEVALVIVIAAIAVVLLVTFYYSTVNNCIINGAMK